MGDCAINIKPTEDELVEIGLETATTAKVFGIDPKVAYLSYSTLGSGKGEEKYRTRNGGNSMQSNCETCMYFGYDEEFEEYFCEVNLDEDEMEKFLTDSFQGGCPYYRLEDEYRTVRKQM